MEKFNRGVLKSINYNDPVVKYRGSKVLRLVSILSNKKKVDLDIYTAIDIFYTFYLPYPIMDDPKNIPQNKIVSYKIIDSMLRSAYIHDLRSRTVADNLLSSVAAGVFITELQNQFEKLKENNRSLQSHEKGEVNDNIGDSIKKNVERAMAIAMSDVENVKNLRNLVEGEQPGTVSMMAYEEYTPQLIRLARNTEVKKVLELLVGIKPWTISISRKTQRYKHGEITGYELGKDIERIVTSTLALPDELFYLRLLEGKLLLYQKVLTQSLGPLYCLLDKSGSMDGIKMTWAKAVVLSLYMRAVKEHREFYFRFFDSVPYPLAKIDKKPKARQVLKLLEYIARVKGSGGTDISRAIILAANDIRSGIVKETSDIVLITDGVDRIAEQLVTYNLKKSRARLITVMILGDNKSLRKISAKYFIATKLSKEDMLQVVEA
ncbi:MAG: hypothetical protein DRO40_03420 [Thermoprotei archaeon]|nr:MAG: hypothetical protein DRO40_03420 [Thermoprotei archaeon]